MEEPFRRQLAIVDVLTKALTIIEALVNRPDAIHHGDVVREKISQLRDKMHSVQGKLDFISGGIGIYDQWIQRQKDLNAELKYLEERLDYVENNLPDECFRKIAADYNEQSPSPLPIQTPRTVVNGYTNGFNGTYDGDITSIVTVIAKNKTKPVPKKEEVFPHIKQLTQAELDQVPKYLRGRMQLDVISTFIESFNAVMKKKYALLKIPKNKVPRGDLPLYIKWKTQDNKETKGHSFITDNDLSTFGPSKLGKRDFTILQILRHCKRLKESKYNGECYYLLLN